MPARAPATAPGGAPGNDLSKNWVMRCVLRPWLAALLAYVALAVAWTLPVWLSGGTQLIGFGPAKPVTDAYGYAWMLGWVTHSLAHGHIPVTTTLVNYPQGAVEMAPYPPYVLTVLSIPALALMGVVNGYNAMMVAAVVIDAIAAYAAARVLGLRFGFAWFAGLLFAAGPFVTDQAMAGHPDIMFVPAFPLALALLRLSQPGSGWSGRRVGIAWAAVISLQLLTNLEMALDLGAAVGCGVLVYCVLERRRWREIAARLGQIAIWAVPGILPIAALIVVPETLFLSHISGALNKFAGGGDVLQALAPDVGRFLNTSSGTLGLNLPHTGTFSGSWEVTEYLSIPLIVVVVWALRQGGRLDRWLAGGALIAMVFAIGPHLIVGAARTGIPLPMDAMMHLPFMGNITPPRLSVVEDLCLAVLAGRMLQWLAARIKARWVAVVGLAVLVPWLPVLPAGGVAATVPAYFTDTAFPPNTVILVVPYVQDASTSEAELWQAAAHMGFSQTGGYFTNRGRSAQQWTNYGPPVTQLTYDLDWIDEAGTPVAVTPALRQAWLEYLAGHHVTEVVQGPGPHSAIMTAFITQLMGRSPSNAEGVQVWAVARSRH